MRIVVVGASLAGLRAVETLRREGYADPLVLIGAEPHLPYDRPPLSKQVLRGEWDAGRTGLRRKDYAELDLDLRLGRRALGLRPAARKLQLDDGGELAYDGLLIATGAEARELPGPSPAEGVYVLRTLDQALALRAALEKGPHVSIVGAGFIGAEVAASCRALGLEVAMIEPEPVPMRRGLGDQMGRLLADIHRSEGVDLRLGVSVESILGSRRVEGLALSDGSRLPTDLVVVGIGAVPQTDWLQDSGLRISDGLVCDSQCVAGPGIVAAGDVARFWNPLFDEEMRVEHWTNAVEQGEYAARRLLSPGPMDEDFAPVPLFWTDQFDFKLQFAGRLPGPDARFEVVSGDPESRKFVAVCGTRGRLVGALAMNNARRLIAFRQAIAARTSLSDARALGA